MRMRLDQALIARGLMRSRAQAQAAIAAGLVRVDGAASTKPSLMVKADAVIEAEPTHPWASRGGVKLAHALDVFGVDPAGRVCLDLGASAGGFTDVLLARGARLVHAVDVGHGQLDPRLAADPRVVAREGLDARKLSRGDLPTAPSLVVADLSFIGLAKALPTPLSLAAPEADLVALLKPQFEAGPGPAPDEEKAAAIAEAVAAALDGLEGFSRRGLIESPIRGGEGAREFLLYARRTSGQ